MADRGKTAALYCTKCGRYLTEAYVAAVKSIWCPQCGEVKATDKKPEGGSDADE